MCAFREKHDNDFTMAYKYLEKHYGTHTDEEWEAVANGLGKASKNAPLAVKLIGAVLEELDIIHREADKVAGGREVATGQIMRLKKSNAGVVLKEQYRPVFARVYNFARRCYFADPRNPNHAEELTYIEKTLEHAKMLSLFEREMFERCHEVLFRAE